MFVLLILSFVASGFCQQCPEPEGYYSYFADSQQCDRFIQCLDGVAQEKLCPDGLLFNEKLETHAYPCSYRTEVDCGSRTKLQPARPTQNCGNSWGYFSSGNRAVCDIFWNCVDGREHQFNCPEGLAFSSVTYRCEWPEQSPDCDVAEYLGFTCPSVRDIAQELTVGIPRYASPRDCNKYFLCVGHAPRLQTCELGTVFNDELHGCDEPENVRGCESYYPADELAEIRDRKEKRRLAAERRQREFQERFAALNSNRN